jgi:hypothetical protein
LVNLVAYLSESLVSEVFGDAYALENSDLRRWVAGILSPGMAADDPLPTLVMTLMSNECERAQAIARLEPYLPEILAKAGAAAPPLADPVVRARVALAPPLGEEDQRSALAAARQYICALDYWMAGQRELVKIAPVMA